MIQLPKYTKVCSCPPSTIYMISPSYIRMFTYSHKYIANSTDIIL